MMLHEEHEYAIGRADGTLATRGLSHPEAMARAEAMQRQGIVARVMHIVGERAYEVDCYPPR
jgi:hypothetical protein